MRVFRLSLLVPGMVALLAGLWGGVVRLGWTLPSPGVPLATLHGPLMVSGFLGTLIGLERAVALGDRWAYAGPLLTGLGTLTLLTGLGGWSGPFAPLALSAGSLVLVAVFVVVLRRQPALFTGTMAAGAGAWLVGNALWLARWPIHRIVLWWVGFLVLTIAGERLELARMLRLTAARRAAFLVAVGLFAAGLAGSVVAPDAGVRLAGAGLVVLAAWLARHDVARRTVRQAGLPRFVALCLLSGYVWLGIGGVLAVLFGGVEAGARYDALLHALFLGFVFAMIFGHAPIIFPAVLGLPVRFRSTFYVPLVLLHLTLLVRVVGDLVPWLAGRAWGGLLNALTVGLFLASTAHAILLLPPQRHRVKTGTAYDPGHTGVHRRRVR